MTNFTKTMRSNRFLPCNGNAFVLALTFLLPSCASQISAPTNANIENGATKNKEEQKPVQVISKEDAKTWLLSVWTPESLEMARTSKLQRGASGSVLIRFTMDATIDNGPCNSFALINIKPNDALKNDAVTSEFWDISYCGQIKRTEISIDGNDLKINGVKAVGVGLRPL